MSGAFVSASRLLTVAALTLGVGLPVVEGAMSNGDEAALLITDKDDGKTLQTVVGTAVTLKLSCQPGTGYAWAIAGEHKLLEVVGEPKIEGGGAQRVGGVAQQVFRLRMLAAGTTTLELHLVRSWEKDAKPQKAFRVTLEIR